MIVIDLSSTSFLISIVLLALILPPSVTVTRKSSLRTVKVLGLLSEEIELFILFEASDKTSTTAAITTKSKITHDRLPLNVFPAL
jgi:multisubunit Na+/H+ antiporter MnhC subunit